MKVGIIIYSLSRHTLTVASRLEERLGELGHAVTLEEIAVVGPAMLRNESAPLGAKPATGPYDAVVFGSPVRGGVMPPPVQKYFEQAESLDGMQTAILVTGFFPAQWGRNQVIAQIQAILEEKGAQVCGTGSVDWFSLNRRKQIMKAVDNLSNCLVN